MFIRSYFNQLFFCLGFTLSLIAFSSGLLPAETIPPMPEGYASETAIKAALLLGQVELIDPVNVPIPDTIQEIKDIEYKKIGDRSLALDLYLPDKSEKPVPAILFIHGGAWSGGERGIMKFYCVDYARKGYATATVSYRLSKEAPFPAAVHDTLSAVRWIRGNAERYDIDPNKIAVSGNSAGGHLSMMIGYGADDPKLDDGASSGVSARVQAVINFYGPTDLTTSFARQQGPVKTFLDGKTYEDDPDLYAHASPMTYLTKDDPPTLILHGTIDTTVPIDQADILENKLKELNIPYMYEKFEGWPHTMDLAKAVNDRCRYQMDQFLAKYLPLNRSSTTNE